MWTDYQRHPGRTRKRKSLCGPSTNGIDNHTIPGVRPEFFTDGTVFSLLHAGFFCAGYPSKIVSILYIRVYTCEGITLILFPFSGSRHPPFVFVD